MSLRVKWPYCEADNMPLYSTEVKLPPFHGTQLQGQFDLYLVDTEKTTSAQKTKRLAQH
jgi:hypothetical protein